MNKPWDEPDKMYSRLYKISCRYLISKPHKILVHINGQKILVDAAIVGVDTIRIVDGNKTIQFYRAERSWVGKAPRHMRGKWMFDSMSTCFYNY